LGLDQIPESLFPLLACRVLLPLNFLDIAIAVLLFCAGSPFCRAFCSNSICATGPIERVRSWLAL
jgi:hypothetical protein